MKYEIRTHTGEELTADGNQVVRLFRQKFLEPHDEIRKVGAEKWRRIGDIPEYASMMQAERSDVTRFKRIFLITFMLACLAIVAAALVNL